MSILNNLNSPEQVKQRLGISLPTLARWRGAGEGPPFIKMGHRVAYTDSDLEAWLQSQRRSFTGQTA